MEAPEQKVEQQLRPRQLLLQQRDHRHLDGFSSSCVACTISKLSCRPATRIYRPNLLDCRDAVFADNLSDLSLLITVLPVLNPLRVVEEA